MNKNFFEQRYRKPYNDEHPMDKLGNANIGDTVEVYLQPDGFESEGTRPFLALVTDDSGPFSLEVIHHDISRSPRGKKTRFIGQAGLELRGYDANTAVRFRNPDPD